MIPNLLFPTHLTEQNRGSFLENTVDSRLPVLLYFRHVDR